MRKLIFIDYELDAIEMSKLQKYSYLLLAICLSVFVLMQAKIILVPLVFAIILFLLLLPLHQRWLSTLPNRILAVLLTLLSVLFPLALVITFFSLQIADVIQQLPSIGDDLQEGIQEIVLWVSENKLLQNFDFSAWTKENLSKVLEEPINLLQLGISESTQTLSSIVLTFIYLLFLLLYERGIKRGAYMIIDNSRTDWREILGEIRKMIQKYLRGVLIVMVILAVLNSFGLWLIGIDYPVFWGALASLLALIPYLGTFLGGLLPLLYSIAVGDNWLQPVLIITLFSLIQFVEGNFITPKIVGDQVSLNPLTAIFALLVGAFIWGLAGVVLAIPMAAILRIVCRHFESLHPIAFLMGPEMSH